MLCRVRALSCAVLRRCTHIYTLLGPPREYKLNCTSLLPFVVYAMTAEGSQAHAGVEQLHRTNLYVAQVRVLYCTFPMRCLYFINSPLRWEYKLSNKLLFAIIVHTLYNIRSPCTVAEFLDKKEIAR